MKQEHSYYVHENFVYKKNRVRGRQVYFACKNSKCSGTLSAKKKRFSSNEIEFELIYILKEHNHECEPKMIETLRFKRICYSRAEGEATTFRQIFDEEQRRFPKATTSFASIRKTMSSIRERACPRIPKTFPDLYNSLVGSPM
ncbi:hypothetical protein Avbf_15750 [Armadillidium vulgare]|nr:hypothetical protein Avbf_15750 [Armadillidium vulgare]